MSNSNMTDRGAFDKLLMKFKGATTQSKEAIRNASEMALRHFAEHGDVVWLQDCLVAIEEHKNYVRRAAFLKWAAAHAPLTLEEGKLVKDKSKTAVEMNIEGACKQPFWEFAPDPEQVNFSTDDVVVALKRTVKKFHRDRYNPASEAAAAKLAEAETAIAKLA